MGSIPIIRCVVRVFSLCSGEVSPAGQGVAQSGSASVLGTGGHRFKSCHPEIRSLLLLFVNGVTPLRVEGSKEKKEETR
jgi:hypothetical protein